MRLQFYRSSYPDFDESKAGNKDEEEEMETDVTPDALAAEGYELVLPSGRSTLDVQCVVTIKSLIFHLALLLFGTNFHLARCVVRPLLVKIELVPNERCLAISTLHRQ